MKNSIKSFLTMTKFETIRVGRNKFVIFMLLFFAIFFILMASIINSEPSYKFAIACDKPLEEISGFNIIEENFKNADYVFVDSEKTGIDMIKKNKVVIFIHIDCSKTPEKINIHYDNSSFVASSIKQVITNEKDAVAYDLVSNYLEDAGIKINDAYFKSIDFKTINNMKIIRTQRAFPFELATAISVILMLGITYSVSKDNETNVAKNTCYLPVGINKYMWSKLTPYILLGILESIVVTFLGLKLFGITSQYNTMIIVLLSFIFVFDTTILALLFSTFKNQVSALFCDLLVMLLPILAVGLTYLQGLPMAIQIFMHLMPMIPFVFLFNGMLFSGVLLWEYVLMLLAQTIVYYIIAYLIMRKKTHA